MTSYISLWGGPSKAAWKRRKSLGQQKPFGGFVAANPHTLLLGLSQVRSKKPTSTVPGLVRVHPGNTRAL